MRSHDSCRGKRTDLLLPKHQLLLANSSKVSLPLQAVGKLLRPLYLCTETNQLDLTSYFSIEDTPHYDNANKMYYNFSLDLTITNPEEYRRRRENLKLIYNPYAKLLLQLYVGFQNVATTWEQSNTWSIYLAINEARVSNLAYKRLKTIQKQFFAVR